MKPIPALIKQIFAQKKIADNKTLTVESATATPEAGGARPVFDSFSHAGMTPERLAALLTSARHGDADDYLALAEYIEEADLDYRALLSTRKQAVTGLPLVVEAASDSAQDVEVANLVREVLAEDFVANALYDALDALGKGYSVQEIVWNTAGKYWKPADIIFRAQNYFFFDKADGSTLLLRSATDKRTGSPLAAYKFIVHKPKLKSGLQIRSGLSLVAAWAWLVSSITNKNWLSASETDGKPYRVGKFAAGTPREDVLGLKAALSLLGSDAYAVLPSTMDVNFLSGNRSDGAIFEKLARYFGELKAKLVLGQTKTSDGTGGSNALAQVHDAVRGDILSADAKALAATLKRDLVTPLVRLNFGEDVALPQLRFQIDSAVDIVNLATALEKLVPLGLEVEASVIRDRLGLPDPVKGAVLLGSQAQAPTTTAVNSRQAASGPACPVHDAHASIGTSDSLDSFTDEASRAFKRNLTSSIALLLTEATKDTQTRAEFKKALLQSILAGAYTDTVALMSDTRAIARAVGAAGGNIGDGVA